MKEVLALLGLWCFVGVKFLIGPASVLAYGLGKIETILFVSSAAIFWSLFFYFLGGRLQAYWRSKFPSKKSKRVFTKSNRQLVRFKNKFGIWGLAFLIPIISVPISALVASKYFKNDSLVWLKYGIPSIFWTIVLTYFSEPLIAWLKALF
ncbi:MAG: hypothetical protein ACPF8V_08055 [Luteibaculum sp.]